MTRLERAAVSICEHTERQRASYMLAAQKIIDQYRAKPLPPNVALQIEEFIYQAGNCDARLQRFQRIASPA